MPTASTLSKTARKLHDHEIGTLQRRVNEIIRRIEEGTVEFGTACDSLQSIVENRMVPAVIHSRRAQPLEFKRPPVKERRMSKAPIDARFPNRRTRLNYIYRTNENIMAEMWEAECIPRRWLSGGRTPIDAIMEGEEVTKRDVMVINSTLQWLATNVGNEFLTRYVRVSQIIL